MRASIISLVALTLIVMVQQFAAGDAPTKPLPVYDESADATRDVASAVRIAGFENQRVLLVMGGNWCHWCRLLHDLCTSDKDIRTELRSEYQVVNIDIGHGEKNVELLKTYGITPNGYPYLAVLNSDNKLVVQQETGALENGPKHDREKVLAFLKNNTASPLDAKQTLDASLADAKANGKRVFVHFGAPWCGWCHKLEDVIYQPNVTDAITADYVMTKIDTDRMTGGSDLLKKYQTASGGIPWYAILDGDGNVVSTSDISPGNNMGFPSEPAELDHFMHMFTNGHRHMTDGQITAVKDAIRKGAAEVKTQSH